MRCPNDSAFFIPLASLDLRGYGGNQEHKQYADYQGNPSHCLIYRLRAFVGEFFGFLFAFGSPQVQGPNAYDNACED